MFKFLTEKKNDEPKNDAKFLLQKVKDNYYLNKRLSVGSIGKISHSALVKTRYQNFRYNKISKRSDSIPHRYPIQGGIYFFNIYIAEYILKIKLL